MNQLARQIISEPISESGRLRLCDVMLTFITNNIIQALIKLHSHCGWQYIYIKILILCPADSILWEENNNAINYRYAAKIDIEGRESFEASLHKYFKERNTKKHQFTSYSLSEHTAQIINAHFSI